MRKIGCTKNSESEGQGAIITLLAEPGRLQGGVRVQIGGRPKGLVAKLLMSPVMPLVKHQMQREFSSIKRILEVQ